MLLLVIFVASYKSVETRQYVDGRPMAILVFMLCLLALFARVISNLRLGCVSVECCQAGYYFGSSGK